MSDIEKMAKVLCSANGELPERWEVYRERAEAILIEFRALRVISEAAAEKEVSVPEIVDSDEYIDVCVGVSGWRNADHGWIVEDDYRVAGEIWRVHKSDADPFPSKPHAHCVGGAKRFVGCKLHLGTGQLFMGSRPLGRFLAPPNFDRLLALIRPKFPEFVFPLQTTM
jgi:hypothetical protein